MCLPRYMVIMCVFLYSMRTNVCHCSTINWWMETYPWRRLLITCCVYFELSSKGKRTVIVTINNITPHTHTHTHTHAHTPTLLFSPGSLSMLFAALHAWRFTALYVTFKNHLNQLPLCSSRRKMTLCIYLCVCRRTSCCKNKSLTSVHIYIYIFTSWPFVKATPHVCWSSPIQEIKSSLTHHL